MGLHRIETFSILNHNFPRAFSKYSLDNINSWELKSAEFISILTKQVLLPQKYVVTTFLIFAVVQL